MQAPKVLDGTVKVPADEARRMERGEKAPRPRRKGRRPIAVLSRARPSRVTAFVLVGTAVARAVGPDSYALSGPSNAAGVLINAP